MTHGDVPEDPQASGPPTRPERPASSARQGTRSERSAPPARRRAQSAWKGLPSGIWAMGFVSLLMDASSEMIHSVLPVFLATVLGASMVTIGLIEGIAEAIAAVTKFFSGTLSDALGRRKRLVLLGYGLAAATKPVFPLATSVGWVAGARFVDRVGKGIRGAPRDALVTDLAPPELRGAAFGLRQALDSVGAVIGPLLALAALAWFTDDLQRVLWIATIPAALAVLVLAVGVKEPVRSGAVGRARGGAETQLGDAVERAADGGAERVVRDHAAPTPVGAQRPEDEASRAQGGPGLRDGAAGRRAGLRLVGFRRLSSSYWLVVAFAAVLTLARFSEAFLVLRAQHLGLALAAVPVVLIVMNVVYAGVAYPAGAAADRLPKRTLLLAGIAALIGADLVLAAAKTPSVALVGAALWGLHMALTQGLLAKLVADTVPADLRGTGFGVFHLVSGVALLLASAIAGLLWTRFGAPATFLAGAGCAAVAGAGLSLRGRR